MVNQTVKYFDTKNLKYEILFVNDGSRDNTWGFMKDIVDKHPNHNMIAVNYPKNGGKGFAVRTVIFIYKVILRE